MRALVLCACCGLLVADEASLRVERAAVAPRVSAELDDPAWSGVPETPLGPVEQPTAGTTLPATTVRALWLPEALHIRFACRDDDIYAPITGHDAPLYQADAVEVFIDPVGDGRAVYEFQVSPHGDVFDQLILATAPQMTWAANGIWTIPDSDIWFLPQWDPRQPMHVAAKPAQWPDGTGWIADLAIPAEVMRRAGRGQFAPGPLRAHLVRVDWQAAPPRPERLFASASLAPYPNGNPHRSAVRMARLELVPAP